MNANQNGSLGSDRLSKYESIRRPHGRKIWIIPFCRAAVAGLAKSEIILNSKIGTLYICTIQCQWKFLPEKYLKKNYLLDEYKKPLDRRLWTGWSRYNWTCFPSPMRFCLPMFITDTYISFKPFHTGYKFWLLWSARYWLTPWGLGMETPSVVLKTNYEFGFKLYSDQYWGAA